MTTSPRCLRGRLLPLAVILAAAVLVLVGTDAQAGDKRTGRIDLEARLEPADLAPGGSGTLVVTGTLLGPKHHIYSEGEQAIAYVPVEAEGVTYDLAAKTVTPSEDYTDEFTGEEQKVWHNTFTLRVPVTIAEDAAPDTKVGLSLTYYGCISGRGCYPPVKNHVASVALGGGKAAAKAPADGNGGGAKPVNPQPDIAADTVQVAPAVTEEEGGAEVRLDEEKGVITVSFTPSFGWHFYGPDDDTGSIQVSVEPVPTEGVTFGTFEMPGGKKIEALDGYRVEVPFTREDDAKVIEIKVGWQGCSDAGSCNNPRDETFRIVWPGGETAAEPAADESEEPVEPGEVLFPVVEGDDIGAQESDSSLIQRYMRDTPLLGFGLIFIIGLGLAFTPCVLPIVPITVSVITGGNADIEKRRLTTLLLTYVGGLAITFGLMGVLAALLGGGLATAFTLPAVQWGIAILFIALAFSMIGVYELQPPAFLMNLQGGAQKRQGSIIGAFLFGCLGAVIASPCVAPVVAGMLIVTANTGSIPLGFSMFFTLGIGMGAVFFAAGALNFLMRPGPWMVWVRYVFGMLLLGVALYYLKSGGHISDAALWGIGLGVSLLAMLGVAWHLQKKEGEDPGPARARGAKVAVLFVAAVVAVFFITKKRDDLLDWVYVEDSEHLVALVDQAKAEGKPAVVDFWAEWCFYCKEYDTLIASEPEVRKRFEKVMRIKVDLTDDDQRWDVRHAVGQQAPLQPFLVFIDRQGRIRRAADVDKFLEPEEIVKRLDLILKSKATKTSKR